MIVATLLLQCSTATMQFSAIFANVKQIYGYLVTRGGVKMFMREPPSRISVLENIKKLGFEVSETIDKQRKSRVKNYTINMDAKKDQKIIVGLSYYSNTLLQNLFMDSCVSKLIVRHMIVGDVKKFDIEELVEQAKFIAKVVRNEYLLRDPRGFPETIHHRIDMLQRQNEILRNKDSAANQDFITLNRKMLRNQVSPIQGPAFSMV